jgi:integrase
MAKQAKVLTQKEFVKLLKAVSLTRHPLRNKTMVFMSYFAGARACEIANIRVSDVIGADGVVLDVVTLKSDQTKGHAAGRLFINKQLQKQLSDYLKAKPILTSNPTDRCSLLKRALDLQLRLLFTFLGSFTRMPVYLAQAVTVVDGLSLRS